MKEEKKMRKDIQKHKKEGGVSEGKDEIKQEEPNGNVKHGRKAETRNEKKEEVTRGGGRKSEGSR